jgi:phospho-N-acetylmuramoyl-pentapeptide-transferase
MLLLLIDYLRNHFGIHVPAAFGYTSTRLIFAAAFSLLCTTYCGKWFIAQLKELSIKQPIREDEGFLLGELHRNKKNTPTMGGALILFSALFSLLLFMDLSALFTWLLFFTTALLGFLGGYDDYLKLRFRNSKGLSGRRKLFVQFFLALCIVACIQIPAVTAAFEAAFNLKVPLIKEFSTGAERSLSISDFASCLYLPFHKGPLLIFTGVGLLISVLFSCFVIVGTSNAVNLSDGLDGLAAGLLIFVALSLGAVAFLSNNIAIAEYLNIPYITTSGEVAIFLASIGGGSLGFLWYNSHPAEVFMGDTGSLPLGGILGVAAVLLKKEFFLGIIGGIFVAEAGSVILQVICYKFFNKKRIFRCAPLHHHFEYLGWPESKVVIRFWIIGFLLSLVGLLSLKFQ